MTVSMLVVLVVYLVRLGVPVNAQLIWYKDQNATRCAGSEKTASPVPASGQSLLVGFLGAYGQTQVVLGALPLAVNAVNANPSLLPGRHLDYIVADIGSSTSSKSALAALGIRAMTDMKAKGVAALIGPDESCGSEALVAAAWNLPIISYKCAETVPDKHVFNTFARTLPPASKVSKSVVALLDNFKWDRFTLVAGRRPAWSASVRDAIQDLARSHNITVTDLCEFSDYIPRNIQQMETIVARTYETTRVYVFVGEHIALVDLVRCLQRRRLLERGEYIIISVDDEIYDPEKRNKILERDYLDPFLHQKRGGTTNYSSLDMQAFRSVLKLTPSHPSNPDYMTLCNEIRKLSALPPFCVPYHRSIFGSISVPIYAAHLYDAVIIYARAVTELIELGGDPFNGTAVLGHIRNRKYSSVQGFDGQQQYLKQDTNLYSPIIMKVKQHLNGKHAVFIDDNGDAEGNFSVIGVLPERPEVSTDDPENRTNVTGSPTENPTKSTLPGTPGNNSASDNSDWNDSVVNSTEDEKFAASLSMQPVGYFQSRDGASLPVFHYYDPKRPISWVGGAPPKAEPHCGFRGERCLSDPSGPGAAPKFSWPISVFVPVVVVIFCMVAGGALKHYRYEQKLACLLWKIDMREITTISTDTDDVCQKNIIKKCRQSVFRVPTGSITESQRAYTQIGVYRGNIVALKPVRKRGIDLTREIRKELKQMREARHENILPLIGASVEQGAICLITPYCSRGSLEDVLANNDLHLDNMFIASLVSDILKGMMYIHESDIISHGNLRSSNCLVDNRWVLQIADFGLHEFKAGEEEVDGGERALRRCLWRAPELLRIHSPVGRGTQKGDVYSFGILLYEIVGRMGPWGRCGLSSQQIVEKVREVPLPKATPFRPDLRSLCAEEYVLKCCESCWTEDPEQRPDIRFVRVKIKEMHQGMKNNIFDNMISIMEKYASNLEGLVQERTVQLSEEKKKTEELLHRMLPRSVAEALKRGDPVEAESFDCVTIYFSDIVGFTELSAESTPLQVIDLLNDLYTTCDSIISNFDVYKVETIGDAYMVASGLPLRNGDRHAGEVASMALRLLTRMSRFEPRHQKGRAIQLRIGIHSGHCVAGVVGLKMPRYCLFGDTVNTASRMESSGEPGRIHISAATYELLERLGGYQCEERGVVPIKGKGMMRTYWLVGEDPERRLARIRDSILSSSFTNVDNSNGNNVPGCSNSARFAVTIEEADRLTLTPDLLRRQPLNSVLVHGNQSPEKSSMGVCPKPCLFGRLSDVSVFATAPPSPAAIVSSSTRGFRSAPVVSFKG